MSQKNTLFNYFGKSPKTGSPGPSTPTTPKGKKSTESPASVAKSGAKRGSTSLDSPKSSKCVDRDLLVAASPRTRVQKALMNSNSARKNVHEPHFLNNVFSAAKDVSENKTPHKLKESVLLKSPSSVFSALQEFEETSRDKGPLSAQNRNDRDRVPRNTPNKYSARPVRNLNAECFSSPSKFPSSESNNTNCECVSQKTSPSEDVYAMFGQYIAAEMRTINDEQAVHRLKQKIMEAIHDVQSNQSGHK